MLTNCRYNPSGPTLGWAEQYGVALQAAHEVDAEAALDYISVKPVASWPENWSISNTLKVSFGYKVPSGGFYVEWHDSNPDGTIKSWSYGDSSTDGIEQELYDRAREGSAKREQALKAVTISPRKAEEITWQEALVEAERDGVEIHPSMYLHVDSLKDGEHPTWEVDYSVIPTKGPPGIFDILALINYSSKFTVDAVTGEVLERDMGSQTILIPAATPMMPIR